MPLSLLCTLRSIYLVVNAAMTVLTILLAFFRLFGKRDSTFAAWAWLAARASAPRAASSPREAPCARRRGSPRRHDPLPLYIGDRPSPRGAGRQASVSGR